MFLSIFQTDSKILLNAENLEFNPPNLLSDVSLMYNSNSTGNFIDVQLISDQFFTSMISGISVFIFGTNYGYLTSELQGRLYNDQSNSSIWKKSITIDNSFPKYVYIRFIRIYISNDVVDLYIGDDFVSNELNIMTNYDNSVSNEKSPIISNISTGYSLYKNETILINGTITGVLTKSIISIRLVLADTGVYLMSQSISVDHDTGAFQSIFTLFDDVPNNLFLDYMQIKYYNSENITTVNLDNSTDFQELEFTIIDGRPTIPQPLIKNISFTEIIPTQSSNKYNISLDLENTTEIIYVSIDIGTSDSTFRDSVDLSYNSTKKVWENIDVMGLYWPKDIHISRIGITDNNYNSWWLYQEKDYTIVNMTRTLNSISKPDNNAPEITDIKFNTTSINFDGFFEVKVYLSDVSEFYMYSPPYPLQYLVLGTSNGYNDDMRRLKDPLIENGVIVGVKYTFSIINLLIHSKWNSSVIVSKVIVNDQNFNNDVRKNGIDFTSPLLKIIYPSSWYSVKSDIQSSSSNTTSNITKVSITSDKSTIISSENTSIETINAFYLPMIIFSLILVPIIRRKYKNIK